MRNFKPDPHVIIIDIIIVYNMVDMLTYMFTYVHIYIRISLIVYNVDMFTYVHMSLICMPYARTSHMEVCSYLAYP